MSKRTLSLLAGALALAIVVGWLAYLRTRAPLPEAASAPTATPEPPPVATHPPVQALLAGARQLRADPAAFAGRSFSMNLHPSGVLRFVGMEPGWSLGAIRRDTSVPDAAREFVLEHREAWGLDNPRIDLLALRHRALPGRDIVRMQQLYGGVPVFAAQAIAHVRDGAEITCVLADAAMIFGALDRQPLPLRPALDATAATASAREAMHRRHPAAELGPLDASQTQLIVYAPEVLGFNGDAELAWMVTVAAPPGSPEPAAAQWIVSADDGEVLNYFDKLHTALARRIFDANSSTAAPALPTRNNGSAAVGLLETDNAYDFITQTYNYYAAQHARDSFNGAGATIDANVRICTATQCPWNNANSGSGLGAMSFGGGYVTDDIVAHEFTHKVIEFESGLLYQNASGAINESLCDIWGELFDQSNSGLTPSGNDTAAVRWLVGEDRTGGAGGAIRNMRNPPLAPFSDPDRIGHANFQPPVTFPRGAAGSPDNNDNGGVHINSGVGNKLCYLLCDGDTFNGLTISSLGNNNTLALFYETNTNLLTPASDWLDLNFAIRQAAINLGYFSLARLNIGAACDAVEIHLARHTMHLHPATNAPQKVGIPEVVGNFGPFNTLAAGMAAAGAGGTLKIQGAGGALNVANGFTITQPITLRTYDAFLQVSGTAANAIPPVPVLLLAP